MRGINLIIIIFLILVAGAFIYLRTKPSSQTQTATAPVPTVKISTTPQPLFCALANLQANIALDAAAGNIYGTLTIKNISGKPCRIRGNNFIQPLFVAQNINISPQEKPGKTIITLSPNETVYSKVHFPNGPQCESGIQPKNVSFNYQISISSTITFKDEAGKTEQSISACKSTSEKTEIQVWSISDQPPYQ